MAETKEFLYPEKWLSKASAGDRVTSELRINLKKSVKKYNHFFINLS
jgi:hypothetical protein